jgi:glucose/arabinose dehydrogenase
MRILYYSVRKIRIRKTHLKKQGWVRMFIKSKFHYSIILAYFLSVSILQAETTPRKKPQKAKVDPKTLSFQLISDQVEGPVGLVSPKDGTNRLFLLEQSGKIKVLRKNSPPLVFLDMKRRVAALNQFYSEKGLLGLAFHPNYKENRKFYINYSANSKIPNENHRTVISEMVTSFGNSNKAMARTEKIILEISQPESNHNGGTMEFGPDGYLYISSGDGGGAGDDHGNVGNAQNLESLLGKILRIDINTKDTLYTVPIDNPNLPHVGKTEIFAYGLRNPWKFSFDRKTKRLFAADVGQNNYEEINIIEKGKNYGWKIMEGMHCFFPPEDCSTKGLALPIHEYDHSVGLAVIGGYVFRGNSKSPHFGKYIFGDWNGKIFSLTESKGKWISQEFELNKGEFNWQKINSFGEDEKGNLYILTQDEVGPTKKGYVFQLNL